MVLLASSGGVVAAFAQAFWGTLYLAAIMVGGAWLWVVADIRQTVKRPARSTLTTMAVATTAVTARRK